MHGSATPRGAPTAGRPARTRAARAACAARTATRTSHWKGVSNDDLDRLSASIQAAKDARERAQQ